MATQIFRFGAIGCNMVERPVFAGRRGYRGRQKTHSVRRVQRIAHGGRRHRRTFERARIEI